jgi:hypothetical protein
VADAPGGNGSRWMQWVPAIAGAFMILASVLGWFVTVTHLQDTVAIHEGRIGTLEAKADVSLRDRAQLDSSVAAIQRDLIEIETQFCESDNIRNLMHANDLRSTAMLWQKVFGEEYPTNNVFYPRVGKCDGAQ